MSLSNKKKYYIMGILLILIQFSILNLELFGDGNMNLETEEIKIWTFYHKWAYHEDGKQSEVEFLTFNEETIINLSSEIKIIIAFYSTFLPKYLFEFYNNDITLARALGNYSTLEEAQKTLLEKTKIDYKMPNNDFPINLSIKVNNNIAFVEGVLYSRKTISDQFKINHIGNIEYIKHK